MHFEQWMLVALPQTAEDREVQLYTQTVLVLRDNIWLWGLYLADANVLR